MLKLYDCSTAPSPRRARMFLAEKGLEWETIDIDLRTGQQLSAEFLKKNAGATVPVLETEDGEYLTENLSIAAYLEAIHPNPPLMGTTPLEKARVLEWDFRCTMGGLMAIAEGLRNSSPHMKGRALPGQKNIEQIPELAERGKMRLGWFFASMERQLAKRDFVAGDHFTLADITFIVTFDFARAVKGQPGEDHPAIQAYMTRMRERPSYRL